MSAFLLGFVLGAIGGVMCGGFLVMLAIADGVKKLSKPAQAELIEALEP